MKTSPILHSETQGSGPTVVLLHGYMASTKYWNQVAHRLAKRHTVITLDLLGFGKSPKPRFSRYDYEAQLRSIEVTLENLRVHSSFKLVGHSMGALVALRYTREHPERVEQLLLTNMPVWLSREEARNDIYGGHPIFRYVLNPFLHQLFWTAFRIAVKYDLLPGHISEDLLKRSSYLFESSAASRLRSLRNLIYMAKVEADLAAVTVKTTLVSGLSDRKAYVKNLVRMMPGLSVISEYVEGGHHLPLTKPELIVRLVG